MKKILIIDNHRDADCWGASELVQALQTEPSSQYAFYVRRAPERDLPPNPSDFDGLVVSGSKTGATDQAPWIDDLLRFIREWVELKKPYLGVCFGHQMLNRALFGISVVRTAKTPEYGWSKIECYRPYPLFQGLPSYFYSYSAHSDEVHQTPEEMQIFARSEICSNQACQLLDLPIFGIQFHPEKSLASCERDLKNRIKTRTPSTLLHPTLSQNLYQPEVGKFIFNNFLSLLKTGESG